MRNKLLLAAAVVTAGGAVLLLTPWSVGDLGSLGSEEAASTGAGELEIASDDAVGAVEDDDSEGAPTDGDEVDGGEATGDAADGDEDGPEPSGAEELADGNDGLAGGEVERLPLAPIEARGFAHGVWTGEHVVVWGGVAPRDTDMRVARGLADGAVLDLDHGDWEAIPEAPLPGGLGSATGWSGEELVVWGGAAPGDSWDRSFTPSDEGARYDPGTEQWHPVAESPLAARYFPASAWTGEELWIVGGGAHGTEHEDGAAYDPDTDDWRMLPEVPDALRGLPMPHAWTGDELVVWGDAGPHALAPEAETWRALPEPADERQPLTLEALDDGSLVAWYGGTEPGAVRLAADDDAWVDIGGGGLGAAGLSQGAMVASSGGLIRVPASTSNDRPVEWRPDVGDGAWLQLPDEIPTGRTEATHVWAADALLVWGGLDLGSVDARRDGVLWRP